MALGWDEDFAASLNLVDPKRELVPGRVACVQSRTNCVVLTEEGAVTVGMGSTDVAVGDWVALDEDIEAVLTRKSQFSRKAPGRKTEEQVVAANVDIIFLVTGLDKNFNVRRIERYLTVAAQSGAQPVVVLSKADLCDDLDERLDAVHEVALNVDVVAVSALETGVDNLRKYLAPGRTVAVLGSSGVGKSTLVNSLLGEKKSKMVTGAVREDDCRGRHTTTSRELVIVPDGMGILIDTPGMRELQLWNGDGLMSAFEDIIALAANCQFRDCSHDVSALGCAVRAALDDGTLDDRRFHSFLKLPNEFIRIHKQQKNSEKKSSSHKKHYASSGGRGGGGGKKKSSKGKCRTPY